MAYLYAHTPKRTVFGQYHPAVIFLYFAAMIVLTMITLQPVYVVLSLASASAYALFLRGWRVFARSAKWYLVVIVAIACLNAFFNTTGMTVLFYLGNSPITFEALFYGGCAGVTLVSILIWFTCYQEVMTSDKFLCLFSKTAPTIAMIVSMVFRFIPEIIARSHAIANARSALGRNTSPDMKSRIREGVDITSTLMGYSMESALVTADSMRGRGYGSARRTTYTAMRLYRRDILMLIVLTVLTSLVLFLVYNATQQFSFYPKMSSLKVWWGYLPYPLLSLTPLLLEGRERLLWKLSR